MRNLFVFALLAACSNEPQPEGDPVECGATSVEGWSEASHEKGDADASILMGDGEVPRLDLVICEADFQAMQDDLANLSAGVVGGDFPEVKPLYVPATVLYEDRSWPQVGLRYKGNSSLYSATSSGVNKLPFRLSMDHYEDDFPDLEDQRFFGFKDLKFSSGFNDSTLQRDKLTADLFRDAGVPAARGGFVRIYVDTGEGPVYWGLYTVFEDPAGELLDDWFGTDDGNAYKPDGDAATLETFVEADFEKKTNEELADFSDITAMIDALNADTDAESWRTGLEATFDVPGFLRYLAVNNVVGNWDSYGQMTHNYYLYGDPDDGGRLTWIPWDFNEAFGSGRGRREPVNLNLDNISAGWPLLERIADDPVYRAAYDDEVADLVTTVFTETLQHSQIEANRARIAEWADAESGSYSNLVEPFDQATTDLETYVSSRVTAGLALP